METKQTKPRLTKYDHERKCFVLDIPEDAGSTYEAAMKFFAVVAERMGRMEDYMVINGITEDMLPKRH